MLHHLLVSFIHDFSSRTFVASVSSCTSLLDRVLDFPHLDWFCHATLLLRFVCLAGKALHATQLALAIPGRRPDEVSIAASAGEFRKPAALGSNSQSIGRGDSDIPKE